MLVGVLVEGIERNVVMIDVPPGPITVVVIVAEAGCEAGTDGDGKESSTSKLCT